jgi:hypothetical protein
MSFYRTLRAGSLTAAGKQFELPQTDRPSRSRSRQSIITAQAVFEQEEKGEKSAREAEQIKTRAERGNFLFTLKRSNSVPYLNTWEYGNIDADFNVPGLGLISEYLWNVWEEKREKIAKEQARRFQEKLRVRNHARRSSELRPMSPISLTDINEKLSSIRSSATTIQQADVVYKDEDAEKLVYAGTLNKLLTCLADHKVQDKDYIEIFLATHKHFITSVELLRLLMDYFFDPLRSNSSLTDTEANTYRPLIQMRVVNVFKKWLRLHHYDFVDEEMRTILFDFLDQLEGGAELLNPSAREWGLLLKETLNSAAKRESEVISFVADPAESPVPTVPEKITDPRRLSFIELSPLELARQLTLLHFKQFVTIRPTDLYEAAKGTQKDDNPIHAISDFSKKITWWVTSEIISTPHLKKRTVTLNNFIRLIMRLLELNNFHGAMDVYVGVNHYLVGRLKKTWKGVDKALLLQWRQLNELLSPVGSWGNLRRRINASTPPLIIPPAVFLHDMIAIIENDDYWDDEHRLLNFHKMRLFAGVMKSVFRCQTENYQLVSVPVIEEYLRKHVLVLSESELEQEVLCLQVQEKGSKESGHSHMSSTGAPSMLKISTSGSSTSRKERKDKDKEKDKEKEKEKEKTRSEKDKSTKSLTRRASIATIFKKK